MTSIPFNEKHKPVNSDAVKYFLIVVYAFKLGYVDNHNSIYIIE